jgi:hypothetical protein
MKFLLASLKTLTNSKSCSESCIKFLFKNKNLAFWLNAFYGDSAPVFADFKEFR